MVNANGCRQKIYFILFLFIPLVSFAQPRYNVVKDSGFENNDSIWEEFESYNGTFADRHAQPGFESKYSGLTDTYNALPLPANSEAYCYLEQKLVRRIAKDYNLATNIRFDLKLYLPNWPEGYDYWYLLVADGKNRLFFLYKARVSDKLPQEDESTHVVEVNLPTSESWDAETLNFYENWVEKFSDMDTIERIRLASAYLQLSGDQKGQRVNWDNIVFESTRPDSDAAVVVVGFLGNPTAKVENKGAVAVSFPTICDIFKGGNKVYSDTVNVDSLAVDSIKQVSFKPYSDTGEMKVYTVLPGDQNPGNDTLNKNLAIQEAVVKTPLDFKVWPTLTKGIINISSPNPVKIYYINGREVASGRRGVMKFNLEPSGVYFIKSGGEIKKVVRIE